MSEVYDYYELTNIDFKYDHVVTYDLESIQVKVPAQDINEKKFKFFKELCK
jgi:capsid portal protein